jgi:hypothetical protein
VGTGAALLDWPANAITVAPGGGGRALSSGVSWTEAAWSDVRVTVRVCATKPVADTFNVKVDASNCSSVYAPELSVVAERPAFGPSLTDTIAPEIGPFVVLFVTRPVSANAVGWLGGVGVGVRTMLSRRNFFVVVGCER